MMHGKQSLVYNKIIAICLCAVVSVFFIPQKAEASPISDELIAAGATYSVPPALIAAIMENESGFDPNKISNSGCSGLGQICQSSASNSIFTVQCPQSRALGPQLCREATCTTGSGYPECETCTTSQQGCVPDQRFDISKGILGSARVIHSKSDSLEDVCDLTSEAGVKAVAFAYNSGQSFPENAIADLGNCNSYADIWNNVAEHWEPTPATCTIGGSDCGTGTCGEITVGARTMLACTASDGDIEGQVTYPGFTHGMELGKLNRKSDNARTYVTNIYADFLSYGGATPNARFEAITIDRSSSGVGTNAIEALTAAGIKVPTPQISIPGLSFSSKEDLLVNNPDGSQYLTVPYLAEYLAAIYRIAMGFIIILATIGTIAGGIIIMVSPAQRANGTKLILAGVAGVTLAAGSYTLLFVINPDLVNLKSLQVQVVAGIPLEEEFISPLPPGERHPDAGNIPAALTANPPAGAAVGDQYSDSDVNPIPALIGNLPLVSAFGGAYCNQDTILYTIDALSQLDICVGPCHCAYAASHVVNYAGCNIDYTGGAGSLARQLEDDRGWIKKGLDEIDISNNDWGLLVKRCGDEDDGTAGSRICHVGIYGGLDDNGIEYEFDSGSRGFGENDLERYCPSSRWFYDIELGDSSNNCFECSLIPARAPSTGRSGAAALAGPGTPNPDSEVQGTNRGDGCRGIQSWATRPFDKDAWSYVLIAPTR